MALDLLASFIQTLFESSERLESRKGGTSERASLPGTRHTASDGMEAIEVTVRFDEQGKATPVQFSWRGQSYRVESTGRRWEDEKGQHVLVMIPGGRVFEMLFSSNDRRWYLRKTGENRMMV
jgi:hypothetical protein